MHTCMYLRGAAVPQLARGGAATAERFFPHSEQGRWKVGGDLAPAETGLRERPGEGGSLFPMLVSLPPLLQRLGTGVEEEVHSGPPESDSGPNSKVPDAIQRMKRRWGLEAKLLPEGSSFSSPFSL